MDKKDQEDGEFCRGSNSLMSWQKPGEISSRRNGRKITKMEPFRGEFKRIWLLVFERKTEYMTWNLIDSVRKRKEWEENVHGRIQFNSVTQLCPTLCDAMDCSRPGFPVLYYLLEFAQTHVHWISDAIQPSYPLLPSSPLALNLSQHEGLFQWIGRLHQVAKLLELQLQHQSFQWTFRVDFL